ncbi:MAG TPA: VanW family protein [Clostridia bacterium]|nr:VanW family protein [Clostridia bacterium]
MKRPRKNKSRTVLIVLLSVIALMLLSASILAFITLQNNATYKGVTIEGLDVSGLDRQAVLQLLENKLAKPVESMEITLKAGSSELKALYPELGVKYDIQGATEGAYSIGRTGNVFVRLYDIAKAGISGTKIIVPLSFDKEKIDSFVTRFSVDKFQTVKENAVLITDNSVVIRSGKHGESIDRVETAKLVEDMIKSGKGGTIEPRVIVTNPAKFNVDDLYNQIASEPADAGYKVENSQLVMFPHTMGRKIDKTTLANLVSEVEKAEDTERSLPVTFTKPAITSDIVSTMLFRDELAAYSTTFSTATENGRNRKFNMGLAVAKIDGLILLPGDEFSYNNVVGPRDTAHGYKEAHVYINGRVENGVGGGICQVSTTMFNAILKADLQVAERKSHSFTVGYVPLGQDATAYYGGTDFRFVNSTKWPIRLNAAVSGNRISFKLTGTNEAPDKSVIISNKILSQTPHEIKNFDDPNLQYGKTKIKQEGSDGFVVETYKTVKMAGKVISQTKLYTSRYKPCTEEIWVGKKGAPANATTPGAITVPQNGGTSSEAPSVAEPPVSPGSEPVVDEIVDEAIPE